MTAEAIDQELTRDPFVPIRLHLSDGSKIDITNPGLAFIAHLAVYIARTDRPDSRIMDDFQLVSLSRIARLELVEPASR
jgi:hypothetical protein